MKVIRQVPFYTNHTAVALGRFDGLHLGHQSVIGEAIRASKEGLTSCVFTFSRGPTDTSPMLMTPALTEQILGKMGVDILLAPPFDSMKDWSPEHFVSRFLHEQLGAKKVMCGFNYHFGAKAVGTPDHLRELCARYGIEVEVIEPIQECGLPISSTRIRRLVLQGDMPGAARLLGRPLLIDLPVIEGKKVGRLMGTPTINQRPPDRFVIPRRGVYASCCYVGGKVASFGDQLRPSPYHQQPGASSSGNLDPGFLRRSLRPYHPGGTSGIFASGKEIRRPGPTAGLHPAKRQRRRPYRPTVDV